MSSKWKSFLTVPRKEGGKQTRGSRDTPDTAILSISRAGNVVCVSIGGLNKGGPIMHVRLDEKGEDA